MYIVNLIGTWQLVEINGSHLSPRVASRMFGKSFSSIMFDYQSNRTTIQPIGFNWIRLIFGLVSLCQLPWDEWMVWTLRVMEMTWPQSNFIFQDLSLSSKSKEATCILCEESLWNLKQQKHVEKICPLNKGAIIIK